MTNLNYHIFSLNDFSRTSGETSLTLTAEASSLGLKPGEVPTTIKVNGRHSILTFTFEANDKSPDGEVMGFIYKRESGSKLLIIND